MAASVSTKGEARNEKGVMQRLTNAMHIEYCVGMQRNRNGSRVLDLVLVGFGLASGWHYAT